MMKIINTYINEKLVINKDSINKNDGKSTYVMILPFGEKYTYYFDKYYKNAYMTDAYTYFILTEEDFMKSIEEFKKDPLIGNIFAWKIPAEYDEEIREYINGGKASLPTLSKDYGDKKSIDTLKEIDIEGVI